MGVNLTTDSSTSPQIGISHWTPISSLHILVKQLQSSNQCRCPLMHWKLSHLSSPVRSIDWNKGTSLLLSDPHIYSALQLLLSLVVTNWSIQSFHSHLKRRLQQAIRYLKLKTRRSTVIAQAGSQLESARGISTSTLANSTHSLSIRNWEIKHKHSR